jgi:hypothetical protein
MDVIALVLATERRLRFGAWLAGATAGLIALAASASVVGLAWHRPALGVSGGLVLAGGLMLTTARRGVARWTPTSTAAYLESRAPGMDNLVVTATALASGALEASSRMRDEVARQAAARAAALRPASVAPIAHEMWLLALAALGATAIVWATLGIREAPAADSSRPVEAPALQSMRATITPPSYMGRPPEIVENAEQLVVPAGARLHIEVRASTPHAWIEDAETGTRPLDASGNGRFTFDWSPQKTTALVIAAGKTVGKADESRLLPVTVVPDEAPRIRITEPARDLTFGTPTATVDLAVDATDAERLQGVRVTYVRTSGSGESFAFDEGQVSVAVERVSAQHWRGRARLSLSALKLEDGDALVYRALVRDSNPSGEWVSSDAFTIDIGKRLEFAGAGFAVPDEDRRYAISQQMVIVKTERLHADRGQGSPDGWAERSRELAVEQRMVRAEVVFLSGGEVADEVEEAEQSHELQEGRLENAARAEMLRAINDMSRAEAHLNAGDTARALVSERAALAALQQAFDRRRYFLRTLAERSRIDPTRRLSGDRTRAQSHSRHATVNEPAAAGDLRSLLVELATVSQRGDGVPAALIARLASIDPAVAEWRQLAAALTAAATPEERREAARAAMARLSSRGREESGVSAPAPDVGALRGWWSEERREGSQR